MQQIQLPDVLSVDSRLCVGSAKKVEIRKGALNNTTQRTTASSLSNNQITYNVQLSNAIIDSYMYQEVVATVIVTGSGTGGSPTLPVYLANNFALRQFPLASITSVAQVQINNQSVTSNPSQFIHQLSQFQEFMSNEAAKQSITPVMGDQFPRYADGLGSMKSPLLSYGSGGEHYSSPRGEFNADFVTSTGTTGSWVFQVTVREPIFNPLLEYNPTKQREGIPYVALMNIQLNLASNLSRMFSLDAVTCPNVSGISVNITSATLVQQWLTPPLNQRLPEVALRSFNTIVCNQTVQSSFAAGEQRTIQSQSYSMNQIPKKCFIFIGDSQTDISNGYAKSDFCFSIENLTVLFNNRPALLSNMSAADLYNTCMSEEGNRNTYIQSRKFTGAVLALDPAKLFGLTESESPGLLGNFQLQVQCQCTNISGVAVVPNMWVVWAMDTIMTINKSSVTNLVQGFLTEADILGAVQLPAHPASFSEADIYGGSFWDSLKSGFSKVFDFVKGNKLGSKAIGALSNIPQFAPFAPIAQGVADVFGVGRQRGGRRTSRQQMEMSLRQ